MTWEVRHADCVEAMREMPEASVDAIVCDPPYGLEFMGKEWDRLIDKRDPRLTAKPEFQGQTSDPHNSHRVRVIPVAEAGRTHQEWHQAWATEALRILKPGGHLLAFGGSRTFHRLACAIEDAGFEIRDSIFNLNGGGGAAESPGLLAWIYGSGLSGFPKSLNVTKALEQRVPVHERCACGLRSTETLEGSRADCPDRPRSDDGQLRSVGEDDQAHVPSPADVRGRTRDGQPRDGRDAEPASSDPDGDTAPPSSVGSPRPLALPSEGSRAHGSTPSDTASSKSPDESKAGHRTESHTLDRSRSDSASLDPASPLTDTNLPRCPDCNGVVIPQGLGTALKPAIEPIVVGRKPLIGTVAANVEAHGTGALNIDGCRVGTEPAFENRLGQKSSGGILNVVEGERITSGGAGRWPANVALSHLPECADTCQPGCPVAELDRQSGERRSSGRYERNEVGALDGPASIPISGGVTQYDDQGGAARFFYCAKSSRAERNAGLEGFEERHSPDEGYGSIQTPKLDRAAPRENWTPHKVANSHPTVKPIELMRWLVRLVCPPGGTVLDPFAGSGTTGCATVLEGFNFIGIEREAEYVEIARARIDHWNRQPVQQDLFAEAA